MQFVPDKGNVVSVKGMFVPLLKFVDLRDIFLNVKAELLNPNQNFLNLLLVTELIKTKFKHILKLT